MKKTIHCPSCRCEIKRKTTHAVLVGGRNFAIDGLTSLFEIIPIQELITCIRCGTQFLIIEWSEKK